MKSKMILGLMLVFVLAFMPSQNLSVCFAQETSYYRLTENTPLFRTTSTEEEFNVLFELPKTYFVQLIEKIDDESFEFLSNLINATFFIAKSILSSGILIIIGFPIVPIIGIIISPQLTLDLALNLS